MDTTEVINDTESQRFKISLEDGDDAVLDYRRQRSDIALMHTFVPPSHEGKGLAATLVKHAFEYAKANGIKIIVYCPYVAAYLKKHPEYKTLVAEKN